jgi:RNA polymerase primary sigma factor
VAYLDRQLSDYKTSASLINVVNGEKKTKLNNVKPIEEEKNGNFQLAKQLANVKDELIKALIQCPISALWLIDKYQQNGCTLTQDDNDTPTSDLAVSIAELKKNFLILSKHHQNDSENNIGYVRCKQRLAAQLQLFPFSFDDLVETTQLIVNKRNFSALPYNHIDKKKILQAFRAEAIAQHDQSLLFLTASEMPNHIARIVLAEQQWLKARQDLVMANNKLVSFIVNQYRGSFLDFNDLVQEGQTGLLKAVDRFDYRLGFQFSTYAGYWIRQAISRSLSRSERPVRIPCEQVANINRVFRTKEQLTAQTGRDVTVQEIADQTQMSCHDINNILAISQTAIPLEGSEDEDNEASFAPVDFLEQQIFPHPIEKIAETELSGLISEALKILNPREAKVVCCHFGVQSGCEMTLQEIGDELNLTRERVRQIQVIALNKIKLIYGQQLINFLH